LDEYFEKLPKNIELRSSAVPTRKQQDTASKQPTVPSKRPASGETENIPPRNKAPVIQTHSALGILINARLQPKIEFVSPDTYKRIREEQWNHDDPDFYTLLNPSSRLGWQ
jgi:hypothetical protein